MGRNKEKMWVENNWLFGQWISKHNTLTISFTDFLSYIMVSRRFTWKDIDEYMFELTAVVATKGRDNVLLKSYVGIALSVYVRLALITWVFSAGEGTLARWRFPLSFYTCNLTNLSLRLNIPCKVSPFLLGIWMPLS